MKDATGEFTTLVWPQIRQTILRSTYCSQAFNCTPGEGNMDSCFYCPNTDEVGCDNPEPISCPNNNSGSNSNSNSNTKK